MANTIKCPHCNKEFEITEALRHDIKVEVDQELESRLRKEFQEEINEKNKKLDEMRQAELDIRKEKRQLEEEKKNLEVEVERKLDIERRKIEEEAAKKVNESHHMKDLEKDKKIADLVNALEEAKRKGEQGSQQTQGEAFELELEKVLKLEFPNDEIKEVPKGIRGADLIQNVIDKFGRNCGVIIWEIKNAKWSDTWAAKLKEDQRTAHANIAILVSVDLPSDIKNFAFKNGIWITNRESLIGLAHAVRINLGQIFTTKLSQVGKNEKMETLFTYLTGMEFKHRIEAVVESYTAMQESLEKEKRWFAAKWSHEEKDIRKVLDNMFGMYGDLQAIVGAQSLPQVKGLELESGE